MIAIWHVVGYHVPSPTGRRWCPLSQSLPLLPHHSHPQHHHQSSVAHHHSGVELLFQKQCQSFQYYDNALYVCTDYIVQYCVV